VTLAEDGFFLLLGPTLAGKTTLMRLMAGLCKPT
jgi:ABC-type sugar transport system ATPase subunit